MMLTYRSIVLLLTLLIVGSCNFLSNEKKKPTNKIIAKVDKDTFRIYTQPSSLENGYLDFNSCLAINHIAGIENEYFNSYPNGVSSYYGTQWLEGLLSYGDTLTFSNYEQELKKQNKSPTPLHCTHYAIEALKAGLGSSFLKLEKHHRKIWKDREYAGWSVAYILTKHFGWKAYLVVSDLSYEKTSCIKNYKKDKKYHVWKQPNIPIERMYDLNHEKEMIDSLLLQHEFSWGFSDQGWHTWITRFDTLKECYWEGVPAEKYASVTTLKPLFAKTKFTEYVDYHSHILVFPPKTEQD